MEITGIVWSPLMVIVTPHDHLDIIVCLIEIIDGKISLSRPDLSLSLWGFRLAGWVIAKFGEEICNIWELLWYFLVIFHISFFAMGGGGFVDRLAEFALSTDFD